MFGFLASCYHHIPPSGRGGKKLIVLIEWALKNFNEGFSRGHVQEIWPIEDSYGGMVEESHTHVVQITDLIAQLYKMARLS